MFQSDEGAVNGRFLSGKKAYIWTFPQLTPLVLYVLSLVKQLSNVRPQNNSTLATTSIRLSSHYSNTYNRRYHPIKTGKHACLPFLFFRSSIQLPPSRSGSSAVYTVKNFNAMHSSNTPAAAAVAHGQAPIDFTGEGGRSLRYSPHHPFGCGRHHLQLSHSSFPETGSQRV